MQKNKINGGGYKTFIQLRGAKKLFDLEGGSGIIQLRGGGEEWVKKRFTVCLLDLIFTGKAQIFICHFDTVTGIQLYDISRYNVIHFILYTA